MGPAGLPGQGWGWGMFRTCSRGVDPPAPRTLAPGSSVAAMGCPLTPPCTRSSPRGTPGCPPAGPTVAPTVGSASRRLLAEGRAQGCQGWLSL